MNEAIIEPDVEQAVIDYLTIQLLALGDTAKVAGYRQDGRSLRVLRTGGPVTNLVLAQAQLQLTAWDTTQTRASNLLRTAAGLIRAIDNVYVSGVLLYSGEDIGGIGNTPDPVDDRPRYQQLQAVYARATAITVA